MVYMHVCIQCKVFFPGWFLESCSCGAELTLGYSINFVKPFKRLSEANSWAPVSGFGQRKQAHEFILSALFCISRNEGGKEGQCLPHTPNDSTVTSFVISMCAHIYILYMYLTLEGKQISSDHTDDLTPCNRRCRKKAQCPILRFD